VAQVASAAPADPPTAAFTDAPPVVPTVLKGLDLAALEKTWQRVRLTSGARELVATMRARGALTALVSGGFTFFTDKVAAKLGFDVHRSNRLLDDGATLTANPNPVTNSSGGVGQTTISWNAPGSQLIQIRLNSPSGTLFTYNYGSGSMATGQWVTDGMTFYLQDVTGGKSLTPANTLATLTVHVKH